MHVIKKELHSIVSLPLLKILRLQNVFTVTIFVGTCGTCGTRFDRGDFCAGDLRYLKRLGKLRELNLKSMDVTRRLVSNLTEQLTSLDISCNEVITNSGLEHISNLTNLTRLNISDIDVGIE